MPYRSFRFTFAALTAAVITLGLTSSGAAAEKPPTPVDESTLNPTSDRFHADGPQVGARTIQTWTGQSTNPVSGTTYTYSMVGADPVTEDVATITVDIVPINVTVGGRDFNGSDVIPAVLASPLFASGDYLSTTAASTKAGARGPGGQLSAGNTDAQYLDAIMRAQFNKIGTGYHLNLSPTLRRPVTIQVPAGSGITMVSRGGITFADIDEAWFQPQVEGLTASLHYLQPHRLALFITNGVMLYGNHNPLACCIYGAHGTTDTTAEGNGSEGRQSLQTFIWASWITAGTFSPSKAWAKQDISGLSHELAEWAADPFETNQVQPWFSPVAPQYGCNNLLEVGDPVVGFGFSQGINSFDQNTFSDGTYHPQDEVFLPWFMRTSPNDATQSTQSASTAGRYTFLGDLNRVSIFHQAGNAC